MQLKTITGVAAAGALLIASSQAHALSFGEATVRSALGERLLIEIPISSAAQKSDARFSTTTPRTPSTSAPGSSDGSRTGLPVRPISRRPSRRCGTTPVGESF